MVERGKFISVEGPDGAGKTTNLATIEACLTSHGISLLCTREPGGTPFGEQVRSMLLEQHDLTINALAQTLLIFAARAQHVDDVIEPALASGQWVLCDRFTDATRAYQGGGHQIAADRIDTLAHWVHETQTPDLTLIFDVAVDVADRRLGAEAADRFETQATQFKQRVRDTYQQLSLDEPQRVHLINTDRDRCDVAKDVTTLVHQFVDSLRR